MEVTILLNWAPPGAFPEFLTWLIDLEYDGDYDRAAEIGYYFIGLRLLGLEFSAAAGTPEYRGDGWNGE